MGDPMAVRQKITCSSCGNDIRLYEGEKLLENTKCRICRQQLTIPEEYRVYLIKKKKEQAVLTSS